MHLVLSNVSMFVEFLEFLSGHVFLLYTEISLKEKQKVCSLLSSRLHILTITSFWSHDFCIKSLNVHLSVQWAKKECMTTSIQQNSTCCSGHLEPEVMLNVQWLVKSHVTKTKTFITLITLICVMHSHWLVCHTTSSVIASSECTTLKHLKSAKSVIDLVCTKCAYTYMHTLITVSVSPPGSTQPMQGVQCTRLRVYFARNNSWTAHEVLEQTRLNP